MANDNGAAAMSAEQSADLARLEAMAMDEATATTTAQEAAPVGGLESEPVGGLESEPVGGLESEITGLVGMLVAALSPALPSLARIYTPAATAAAAAAVAAVCRKHGWMDDGGLFGRWGEEVAAMFVVGPLALATYSGIRGDIQAAKAAQEKPHPAPAQVAAPVPDTALHVPAPDGVADLATDTAGLGAAE